MSVSFYAENEVNNRDRIHGLHIGNANFRILAQLLNLESPDGDDTGSISSEELLSKVVLGRKELLVHGKEWERSDAPPPERQEDQRLKIMFTPGLSQDQLLGYLYDLFDLVHHAQETGQKVAWS